MLYVLSSFYLFLFWTLNLVGFDVPIGLSIIIFSIFILTILKSSNAAQLMWCIGFFSFFVQPIVLIPPLAEMLNFNMVIAICFCCLFFMFLTRSCVQDFNFTSNASLPILQFCVSCASLLAILILFEANASILIPIIVIHFIYLTPAVNIYKALFLLLIFITFIALYAILVWSGFGRLNLASWLIIVLWIFWQRFSLPYGKIAILFPVIVGPKLLGFFRGGLPLLEQYQSGQSDSNLAPLLQANDYAEMARAFDPLALVDQFVIYFLAFIPRLFWSDKPVGFGFEAVLRESEQYLIDVGHTIAALFVGEHIYFLGALGYFTSFFAVGLVAWTCRFSCRHLSDAPYIHLVVILNLPTFFWGGLSAYSQRAWLGTILLFALFFIRIALKKLMRFDRRRFKNV